MNEMREAQASRVVTVLEGWLSVSPAERSVTLRETSDGWEAELHETKKARGSTALDALAQVATVAHVQDAEVSR